MRSYVAMNEHEPVDTLRQRATELFSLCDQEKKGFITENDLVQVISKLELPLDSKQVEQAFSKLDNDHNGYLTLEEFTEGFGLFLGLESDDNGNSELEEIATSDPGRELFYLCDTDRKGYITKSDLQRVASDLNLNFDQLDLIFDNLDQDSNGRLTLDEFADGFGNFLRGGETEEESNGLIKHDDGIEVETIEPEASRDIFESIITDDPSYNTGEDALFREVVESIGEDVLSGALSKDQLKELWLSLQHNDSRAIHKFEDFLSKVSLEIKRARNDSEQLESALKSKINSHDREVQKLYEEMEQQIKAVRERYQNEQEKREKAIKGQLMNELERKEMEIQWMLNKQKKLEDSIAEKEQIQQEIKCQNEMLLQKNLSLEDQLTDSMMSLEDTRTYVHHLQTTTAEEKEERARHAMQMTKGMQKEQESLIKQLDLLRDANQKLRDDRDTIEAAHKEMLMTKRDRGYSLSDEIEEAEKKHKKVDRQGSKMSRYFDGPSKEAPEWANQGTIDSIEEEGHDNDLKTSSGELKGRRSKRRKRIKKQGAVGANFFSASGSSSSDLPMTLSMNHEVEFDGDVELGKIADDKPATPIWASKIMAAFEKAEEKKKEKAEAETEVEEFRKRKNELLASVEEVSSEGEASQPSVFSSEEYSESDREERPRFPRTAPVGKDDETVHTESASGSTTALEISQSPTRVFKIVFIGDSGVGKSSFIHRFCHDQWKPSFTATIGVDFQIKTMEVDGRCIAIQLWDTAGQERFRSITKQYFRKADGILVFYDVTAESSFINLKSWMASVEEGAEEKATLMIIGNKVDLSEDSNMRVIKTDDGESLARHHRALYMETSAKTGYNINEAMKKLAEVLQDREDEMMQSVLDLVNVPQGKKKKCCKS